MTSSPTVLALLLLLVCTGCGEPKKHKKHDADDDDRKEAKPAKSATSSSPAPEDPFVERHLALLTQAGACAPGSSLVAFCAATKFASPGAATPPATATALPGLSTFVPTEGASAESIGKLVQLSALAFQGGSQGRAWISTVKPNSDAERLEVAAARAAIEGRIAGGPAPTLAPGLAAYVGKLPGEAKYALAAHPKGLRLQGGSNADLRLVGEAWVAIEVPAKDAKGVWVNVYPR